MPAGRPTKYDPAMCQELIDFMAQGYSKEATAAKLGIAKDTLYAWDKKHTEFSDAIKEGEIKSLLFWEKTGMAGMLGKLPGFNSTAWIFNMKNRHKWADKQETKVTGVMGVRDLSNMTQQELDEYEASLDE